MSKVREYFKDHDETLDLFTSALLKAHGREHPEVFKVREVYEDIQVKLEANETNYQQELQKLEMVTSNFKIPEGVCETFEKTYGMFKEAHKIARQEGNQ